MSDAAALLAACRARGIMIATAESCTGGLISAALTDVPGASDVFDRGFVTYSYAAKEEMLGVDHTLLHAHGAVSEEVAHAMAIGALERSDAHLSIAVTGVAGPGGSEAKPEGLVWFGLGYEGRIITEKKMFGAAGRSAVRRLTVEHAFHMIATLIRT